MSVTVKKIAMWADNAAQLSLVPGVLLLAGQVFLYLYSGEWREMPVLTIIGGFGYEWAANPTIWIGLHKLINLVSFPFLFFFVALGFSYIGWLAGNSE